MAFAIDRIFSTEDRLKLESDLTIFQRNPLVYRSGPIRANFVSATPAKWKTNVYVSQENEAEEVLSRILEVLGESFDSNQLSFTTGRKKTPATRVDIWHYIKEKD